jgi:FkbM family methyltransferase
VVLGTIEPRKRHSLILDALEGEVMAPDCPFRLSFVGQSGWAPADLMDRIRELDRNCENFKFLEGLGDAQVGRTLSSAWATIAVSSVEGFGLPAVESLWLGVPVIAVDNMPSLESIDLGVERIAELSAETLRAAVLRILDPTYREKKAADARNADLQTWEDFGRQTWRWISDEFVQDSAANEQWQFRSRMHDPIMVSSAQNLEDVMLARAFRHKTEGFYIDVGAMDPCAGSVTRYFYDLGWRGINVEPDSRFFNKLFEARPRDINLPVALSSHKGRKELFVLETIGMSTIIEERAEGYSLQERRSVETRTLADVCEEFSPQEIDFLKVDVEGAEADVLRGGDWLRFRPKIVVVESTAPFSYDPTWQEWHPLLTLAGYRLVYEDGINRFYCREESFELAGAFRLPPNVLDHYTTAVAVDEHRARLGAESEVLQLRGEILELRRRCSELQKAVKQQS